MRNQLAVPLAIGAAFLVLGVGGCGDDEDETADFSTA